MNHRSLSPVLILGIALAGCAQTGSQPSVEQSSQVMPEQGVLWVPAKELPVPNTVSPELQAFLATTSIAPPMPAPQTPEEWRELQLAFDTAVLTVVHAMQEHVGAEVEKMEVDGVNCHLITPKEIAAENEGRLHVHVHGGGWDMLAGESGIGEALLAAEASKTRVLAVDYRMPPDHPFPAAVEDVVAVWQAVLRDHSPSDTAMFGSSAGGNLVLASVMRLREMGVPLPGALFVGTPGADLTRTGDSLYTNAEVDYGLGRYENFSSAAKVYAGERDMKEPLLSPIYGDFSGFPPTVLITGTRDLLLSHTVRTHRAMRQAGVIAELHVFEGQSHATYLNAFTTPESREAFGEVAQFFDRHLEK